MHVRRRHNPSPVRIILRLNHGFLREESTPAYCLIYTVFGVGCILHRPVQFCLLPDATHHPQVQDSQPLDRRITLPLRIINPHSGGI